MPVTSQRNAFANESGTATERSTGAKSTPSVPETGHEKALKSIEEQTPRLSDAAWHRILNQRNRLMAKQLSEMTFAEAVREGVELELDAVVQGKALHSRVRDVMELALRWASERRDAAKDDRVNATNQSKSDDERSYNKSLPPAGSIHDGMFR